MSKINQLEFKNTLKDTSTYLNPTGNIAGFNYKFKVVGNNVKIKFVKLLSKQTIIYTKSISLNDLWDKVKDYSLDDPQKLLEEYIKHNLSEFEKQVIAH